MKLTSLAFFAKLKWLDGSPLLNHVEPYRRQLFSAALDSGKYNLVLAGRSKKNWKSADLCLAALYALVTDSPGGNQCYLLANDLDQAGDDLSLCKALVECNPVLSRHVVVKQKVIERRDGRGFLLILPAGDIAGSHGKTFRFCGWDEVHGYKSWDLFEALQPDPHRQDVLQWVSTYASLYHRPGVPLFDLFQQGKAGSDPKMLFSWYSGSYTTDPDLDLLAATAEEKANPSRGSWTDPDYLLQQQRRLPSHVYRRLHLCEPGLPSGSAYSVESIEDAIARNVRQRPPAPGIVYYGFVDMSGGSNDGAAFGVSHLDAEGRALLDYVGSQGQRAPFDPRQAVGRFAGICKQYGITRVYGDKYAGERETLAARPLPATTEEEAAGTRPEAVCRYQSLGSECQQRAAAITELERLLPAPEQMLAQLLNVTARVLEAVVTVDREALVRRIRESSELEHLHSRFERLKAMASTHAAELDEWSQRAGHPVRAPRVAFPWPPAPI